MLCNVTIFFCPLSHCPQTLRQTTQQPSSRPSARRCQSTFIRTALAVQVEQVTGTAHCSASRSSLKICGTLLGLRAWTHLCCCLSHCQVSHAGTSTVQKERQSKSWRELKWLVCIICPQVTCLDHPSLTCPSLRHHPSVPTGNNPHCPPLCPHRPPLRHHCHRRHRRHHRAPLQKPKSRRRVAPRRSVSTISRMPSWRLTEWWWPPPPPRRLCPALPPLSSQVITHPSTLHLKDPTL